MELKLLSLFFIFIFSSSYNLDKAGLEAYKKQTKNKINEIIQDKNLETLLKIMRYHSVYKSSYDLLKPMPKSFKLNCEAIEFEIEEFKRALKTLNEDYKKNNINDPFYKEFKNNIELLLNHFMPPSSSYWIYAIYVGVFLGGVGISYTILYFFKKS